jgi:hypothetical protein
MDDRQFSSHHKYEKKNPTVAGNVIDNRDENRENPKSKGWGERERDGGQEARRRFLFPLLLRRDCLHFHSSEAFFEEI